MGGWENQYHPGQMWLNNGQYTHGGPQYLNGAHGGPQYLNGGHQDPYAFSNKLYEDQNSSQLRHLNNRGNQPAHNLPRNSAFNHGPGLNGYINGSRNANGTHPGYHYETPGQIRNRNRRG